MRLACRPDPSHSPAPPAFPWPVCAYLPACFQEDQRLRRGSCWGLLSIEQTISAHVAPRGATREVACSTLKGRVECGETALATHFGEALPESTIEEGGVRRPAVQSPRCKQVLLGVSQTDPSRCCTDLN